MTMGRNYNSVVSSPFLGVVVGMMCGVLLGPLTRNLLLSPVCPYSAYLQAAVGVWPDTGAQEIHQDVIDVNMNDNSEELIQLPNHDLHTQNPSDHDGPQDRHFILVGVMTARKYVQTRALAVHRTWSTIIPGKVLLFTSEGTSLPDHPEVPIVAMPGVDDAYPPQKKSFLMFKYMHDRYGDKYEWFMRADDDIYVKGDKLEQFLLSINSSKSQFIGQAGLGTPEEFGLLSLEQNDNFCMGGPGIVMSRTTLKKMAPHISYCLKNLYTTHEDVEVGRCVRRFAEVSCTWSFEVRINIYMYAISEPLNR